MEGAVVAVTIENKVFKEYSYDEARTHFGYVYITTNEVTNKRYLGIAYRKTSTRTYKGSGHYLKNAIKKYGDTNFTKVIIDVAETKDALEDLEVEYITKIFGYDLAKSNKWYNITSGRQRGGDSWMGLTSNDR